MSEQQQKSPRHNSIIEVPSDDDAAPPPVAGHRRRRSVIEVLSEASEDDDVEFVGESTPQADDEGVEITGHQVYPRPAPRRPQLPRRHLRRRPNPPGEDMLFVDVHADGQELRIPFFYHGDGAGWLQQQQAILQMVRSHHARDEVSQSIMERLEREDERSLDRRIQRENIHNRKVLQKKEGVAKDEQPGYTNNISRDDNLICELCGVVLGEGIPADFKPDPRYNDELEKHASEHRVNAPWFCILQCFDGDVELSKRAFAAKCGHVFCGRCIKNIGNRPTGRRTKKNEAMTITNPHISAPRKCPAPECGTAFNRGKRTFTELFL